ncbi:MAG: DNA methyltransferase [Planctomycetota bacterium]
MPSHADHWTSPDGSITLYRGEAIETLLALDPIGADLCTADPPYSSGGLFKGDRDLDARGKYAQSGVSHFANFTGDNRDGRSFAFWSTMWMQRAARHLKPGGYAQVFADWRQLPTTTDTVQAAGLVWRGVLAWNKGRGSRAPHKGYHRHQCEYVVWASKGKLPKATHAGPFDGCFTHPVRQSDKHHLTGKPTALLQDLIEVVPPGGLVFDPFMGSGTAGVAAARRGLRFVGIELDPHYFQVSVDRIAATIAERKAA